MDIWKIEKPFDYKIFFSNLTPHAVCYLVICHSGKYCTVYILIQIIWMNMIRIASNFNDSYLKKNEEIGIIQSRYKTTNQSFDL